VIVTMGLEHTEISVFTEAMLYYDVSILIDPRRHSSPGRGKLKNRAFAQENLPSIMEDVGIGYLSLNQLCRRSSHVESIGKMVDLLNEGAILGLISYQERPEASSRPYICDAVVRARPGTEVVHITTTGKRLFSAN